MNNQQQVESYTETLAHKMRLDKFFTKFLDTVGDQMNSDNTDTPVWKLYKAKLKEYDEVNKKIREFQYWANKSVLTEQQSTVIQQTVAESTVAAEVKDTLIKKIQDGEWESAEAKAAREAAEEEAKAAAIIAAGEFHEVYNPKPEDEPIDESTE